MINIIDKHKCCGCSACVQKCPKHCIIMSEDNEGFLYPHVDAEKCINCGLCEVVCPIIHPDDRREPSRCYAAINPDMSVRQESSSGGIFSMLADSVIKDGGVVFGAQWNNKWQVEHTSVETKEALSVFRGSKYVQSIIGDSYKQAESFLKEGRRVLFSGTPCQIAGLRRFLIKDYDNLLTVDFICHGVPSPGVFRWYLQEEVNSYACKRGADNNLCKSITSIPKSDIIIPKGIQIENIQFRDKCSGWKNFSFSIHFSDTLEEGTLNSAILSSTLHQHPFLKGFLNNYYLRPSCHQCPAKQFKSGADITIADYWGYDNSAIEDDDTGISAIMISSEKGYKEFINSECLCSEVLFSNIVKSNRAMEHSVSGPYREYFYKQKELSFKRIILKLTSSRFIDKAIRKIWLILHCR